MSTSLPPVIIPAAAPASRELSQEAQCDIDGLRAVQYAAKLMAKSGCFADIKGVDEETAIAKAVVKIAIGRDYGFSAAESMQHIELIQGRPSIAAHARAAKMKAAGYFWKFVKFDTSTCHLMVYSPEGEEIGDSCFTLEDAKRMGLANKDNWQKNPRNMLYCRAISNAQRWYAPEVLSAALATKEEVLDGSYEDTPDGDPRWKGTGSVRQAQAVAEEKIAKMQAERAAANTAPSGADTAAGNPPAETEVEGQEEAAEKPAAAQEDPSAEQRSSRQRPVFGRRQ